MTQANRNPPRGQQGGFTLLELIIVIAIIGILAAVTMPAMKNMPRKAKEAVLKTTLHTVRDSLDQFYGDNGHYPSSLEQLVEQGYLRDMPIDPFTNSAETWVLIYEELDPEEEPAETDLPEDGAPGVWDIRSGAEILALNGETYYSEW